MAPSLSTPTIPSTSGLFSASASTSISAPASLVFTTLLDTSTWPSWSTFVPSVKITSPPSTTVIQGTSKMVFEPKMTPSSPAIKSVEEVSSLSALPADGDGKGTVYNVNWTSKNMPGLLMRTERVNEVEVVGDEECELRIWITFGGAAARAVKWMYEGDLEKRFEDTARDLKGYCEGKWREAKEGKKVEGSA